MTPLTNVERARLQRERRAAAGAHTLTTSGVPDKTHALLKREAAARGLTLRDWTIRKLSKPA